MIRTPLMKHQQLMLKFSLGKPYFGLFADYGVGKTLTVLAYIEKMQFRRSLVVSTKTSIESTWADEISQHSNFRYVMLLGTRSQKLSILNRGYTLSESSGGYYHSSDSRPVIFLVNFDGIKNIYEELLASHFNYVAVDESTKIKSSDSMRTKVLWAFGKEMKYKSIMTGFPVTESLSDIYSQIKFLDNGATLGNSYYAFLDTYFVKAGFGYYPRKKKIKQLLDLIKPFCIRITNDVIRLPPKVYKTLTVPMTPQQDKLLTEFREMFQLEFGKVKIDTQYLFTLINKSLQICDGFIQDEKHLEVIETHKDEALISTLEEIDAYNHKVIIWCAYLFTIKKLERILKKLGYGVLKLTGEVKDVQSVVSAFQNLKKYQILLATQKKAAASITLTNCRYAIYYSNTWSYDERANSEARIRRKGSEHHASIIYTDLVTKGTVESKVYDCLRKKKNLVEELKEEFT